MMPKSFMAGMAGVQGTRCSALMGPEGGFRESLEKPMALFHVVSLHIYMPLAKSHAKIFTACNGDVKRVVFP